MSEGYKGIHMENGKDKIAKRQVQSIQPIGKGEPSWKRLLLSELPQARAIVSRGNEGTSRVALEVCASRFSRMQNVAQGNVEEH